MWVNRQASHSAVVRFRKPLLEKHQHPFVRTHSSQHMQIFQIKFPRFRWGFCTWERGSLQGSCVNILPSHCVHLHSSLLAFTRLAKSQDWRPWNPGKQSGPHYKTNGDGRSFAFNWERASMWINRGHEWVFTNVTTYWYHYLQGRGKQADKLINTFEFANDHLFLSR